MQDDERIPNLRSEFKSDNIGVLLGPAVGRYIGTAACSQ